MQKLIFCWQIEILQVTEILSTIFMVLYKYIVNTISFDCYSVEDCCTCTCIKSLQFII